MHEIVMHEGLAGGLLFCKHLIFTPFFSNLQKINRFFFSNLHFLGPLFSNLHFLRALFFNHLTPSKPSCMKEEKNPEYLLEIVELDCLHFVYHKYRNLVWLVYIDNCKIKSFDIKENILPTEVFFHF